MKLHGYWRSSTTYRVRIALNLKGCRYETVPVNLLAGEHKSAPYLALNPAGTIPTLEWGGALLTQSMAIIDLLEERIPAPSIWPADGQARILVRELAAAIATETHAPTNMRALGWLRDKLGANDDQVKAWVAAAFDVALRPAEQRLAALRMHDGLPFGSPTLFEIVLVPLLYNARRFGMDLSTYPALVHAEATARAIPAFADAAPEAQPDAPA